MHIKYVSRYLSKEQKKIYKIILIKSMLHILLYMCTCFLYMYQKIKINILIEFCINSNLNKSDLLLQSNFVKYMSLIYIQLRLIFDLHRNFIDSTRTLQQLIFML